MPSPHVLIIGGGIGGLALAQGLRKQGIPWSLFERDASPSVRAQGYRIRIGGPGADALQECLNEDMWTLFERTCAEMHPGGGRFNAIDGMPMEALFRRPGPMGISTTRSGDPDHRAYTVDRTMLRHLLLLEQEDNVKFGKLFERYTITSTGVKAFFSDGTSEEGTLLVGADGVHSRVRKQLLPSLRFIDTGCRVIYGKTPLTTELTEHFPSKALGGMTVIQDQTPLTLLLEPVRFPNDASIEAKGKLSRTEDYVYWVLGSHSENFGMSDNQFLALSGKELAQLTLKMTEKWDPKFRSLLDLQTIIQSAPLRITSAKPERPEWPSSDRVTLLGDAIHIMAPAGAGANGALADAALLLHLISREGICEETLEKFKMQMWDYVLPLVEGSAHGARRLLGFKGFEDAKEIDI